MGGCGCNVCKTEVKENHKKFVFPKVFTRPKIKPVKRKFN